MRRLSTKKFLKQSLAAALNRQEYLVSKTEELKAQNRGLRELIKVYEAICLVMGEDFVDKLPKNVEEKNKRLSEILKLLTYKCGDETLGGAK